MKKTNFLAIMLILLSCGKVFSQSSHVEEDTWQSYNADNFVTEEHKQLSNGDEALKKHQFPKDILSISSCTPATGTDAAGLRYLVNKNMIASPFESYDVLIKSGGPTYVTDATFLTYYGDKPYPKDVYKLEIPAPITDFTPSVFDISSCDIVKDSRYVWQETNTIYDNYGNLLEKKIKGNQYVSGIYSYKGMYKIAEVVNAKNSQIAYSSFESDDAGAITSWGYASSGVTASNSMGGQYSYNMGYGPITKFVPLGTYIISFWMHGATSFSAIYVTGSTGSTMTETTGPTVNGWTYKEFVLGNTTGITISTSGTAADLVDEVRLYPKNAQMETMGYFPMVGLSFTCDVSNHFSMYTYDDMGRVLCVKDQEGKITKKMEYGLKKVE